MSATLTPWGRNLLLQAVFNPDTYTPSDGLWMALTRLVPIDNDDASTIDEPLDGAGAAINGYQRLELGAFNIDNWAFSGFSEYYNFNPYTWPAAATGPWGLIQGFALLDSATIGEGNVFAVGELIESFLIDEADDIPPPIDVGGLAIGLYG